MFSKSARSISMHVWKSMQPATSKQEKFNDIFNMNSPFRVFNKLTNIFNINWKYPLEFN